MQQLEFSSEDFKKNIFKALDLAGQVLKKNYRTDFLTTLKSSNNPVTQIDIEVEELIKSFFKKNIPQAGFIGEETVAYLQDDFFFCVDPIDGTKSYSSGYPIFCTLIGVCHQNNTIMGAVDCCITNERWFGDLQTNTLTKYYLAGVESVCQTSQIKILQHAKLAATTPDMFNELELAKFRQLSDSVKITRWGGDAYNYGCLASGHLDLIMEADLKFHDLAALIPIVKCAGGIITDWQNNPLGPKNFSQVLASANKTLHSKALEIINR